MPRKNGDMRCAYYERKRHELMWAASDADLGDTVPGTGGSAPHRSQVDWHLVESKERGRATVVVEGKPYYIGHGNPGLLMDGEENNCLIDSLRQCIGVECSRVAVRRDLMEAHHSDLGRANVTLGSYLDVEEHWRTLLTSIFRHQTNVDFHACDIDDYCVIALVRQGEHGVVLGNLTARYRLVIINTGDYHFDPCLPV